MKTFEETTAECTRLWSEVSEYLKEKSEALFQQWFACVVPLELTDAEITLGVPDDFFADMIRANAMSDLEEALQRASGKSMTVNFKEGYSAPVRKVENAV